MLDAKHGVYRNCLGLVDLKNFNSVRFGYNGAFTVFFKLKEAICLDQLCDKQIFYFKT